MKNIYLGIWWVYVILNVCSYFDTDFHFEWNFLSVCLHQVVYTKYKSFILLWKKITFSCLYYIKKLLFFICWKNCHFGNDVIKLMIFKLTHFINIREARDFYALIHITQPHHKLIDGNHFHFIPSYSLPEYDNLF